MAIDTLKLFEIGILVRQRQIEDIHELLAFFTDQELMEITTLNRRKVTFMREDPWACEIAPFFVIIRAIDVPEDDLDLLMNPEDYEQPKKIEPVHEIEFIITKEELN